MAWIVGERQPLKVGDAYREPGQPIPEADEWPHYIREQYERDRIIVRVADPEPPAAPDSGAIAAQKRIAAKARVLEQR